MRSKSIAYDWTISCCAARQESIAWLKMPCTGCSIHCLDHKYYDIILYNTYAKQKSCLITMLIAEGKRLTVTTSPHRQMVRQVFMSFRAKATQRKKADVFGYQWFICKH